MYKRYSQFFTLWIMLLLTACASMGVPEADTFNKKAIAAYSSISAAAQTVSSLHTAGKLSQERALSTLNEVDALKKAVDAAVSVYDTSPVEGETQLARVLLQLKAVQAALAAAEGSPNG